MDRETLQAALKIVEGNPTAIQTILKSSGVSCSYNCKKWLAEKNPSIKTLFMDYGDSFVYASRNSPPSINHEFSIRVKT